MKNTQKGVKQCLDVTLKWNADRHPNAGLIIGGKIIFSLLLVNIRSTVPTFIQIYCDFIYKIYNNFPFYKVSDMYTLVDSL